MPYTIGMALDVRARFGPPTPIISSLEACCAIGTIVRVMKLGSPERKDTLFEMRDQLDADMGNSEPEDNRIAKIHAVPKGFIQNGDTTDRMMGYVTYGYESER